MLFFNIASLFLLFIYSLLVVSAATIPVQHDSRNGLATYAGISSRGNGQSVALYNDFKKDEAEVEAAIAAGADDDKIKKLRAKIDKGVRKQGESIAKLSAKQQKALDKEIAKANAIAIKVQAANAAFDAWIVKLNQNRRTRS